MSLNVGVLSIQGDVAENLLSARAALDELGIDGKVTDVKTPEEILQLDGLIIPGGESTTIGQLSLVNGSLKILKNKIASLPALPSSQSTCVLIHPVSILDEMTFQLRFLFLLQLFFH